MRFLLRFERVFNSNLVNRPYQINTRRQNDLNNRFFSSRSNFTIFKTCFLMLLLVLLPDPAKVHAETGHKKFPEFPSIRNNVRFWEKIYSTYSINTAVIHDQNDLTKIYEVVALVDKDVPEARKINQDRVKRSKEKFSHILLRLSTGVPPATKEEVKVAAMFRGPSARKEMREAAENIRSQNGLKERFSEGVVRSVVYLKRIRRILNQYGLPKDLAYLPHVESSFNINAVSKSGASGIWQFTRSTGKEYMKINRHIDERTNPFVSTKAAAQLLKKNYEILGSWPLAITAYNYGTSGMMRAVQAHGSYENIFNKYREGYFKFASRNFYSEFLAARNVAERMLGNASPDRTIAAVSTPASQTTSGIRASIPAIKATRVKYVASRPMQRIKHIRPRARPRFYVVKRGDTASSIAAAHKISVEKLCRANNIGPRTIIHVGQNLKIPSQASAGDEKTNLQTSANITKQPTLVPDGFHFRSLSTNIQALLSFTTPKNDLLLANET